MGLLSNEVVQWCILLTACASVETFNFVELFERKKNNISFITQLRLACIV